VGESENIRVYRRLIEGLSDGRSAVVDELIDPALAVPTLAPAFEPSVAGLRVASAANRAAFPDLRAEIVEVFASGEWVAARIIWTGTNDGELMGASPTGKRVAITEIEIVRIVDGKIVDLRQVADFESLSAQLS
jgi:predicted ester cyclase